MPVNQGTKKSEIARIIGIFSSTLYNELNRGTVEQMDTHLKIHAVVDGIGNPVHFIFTGGKVYDSKQAIPLLFGLRPCLKNKNCTKRKMTQSITR